MNALQRGSETIWGEADSVKPLRGIPAWHVETPSHGGYAVDPTWAKDNLSPESLAPVLPEEFGYVWFEEDCNWVLPVLDNAEFADAAVWEWRPTSSPEQHEDDVEVHDVLARRTASNWHAEFLALVDARKEA